MTRQRTGLARRWAAAFAILSLLVQSVAAGPAAAMWAGALRSGHCATSLDPHNGGGHNSDHADAMTCCVLCVASAVHGPAPQPPSAAAPTAIGTAAASPGARARASTERPDHLIASPRAPPTLA